MFVQIIEGRTKDAEGLKRQGTRWRQELKPGAVGFLGATSGVTADGRAFTMARFRDEAAARANSERTEQGSWWAETEKYYEGEVSFTETDDVTEWLGGGSNDAGFVQVMKSTGVDRAAVERLDEQMEHLTDIRTDVIGGYRAWTGSDRCTEVVYFTSEAEARAGEKVVLPVDMQEMMAEFEGSMGEVEYHDLLDPDLY